MISKIDKLLEFLVCPNCKNDLKYNNSENRLDCNKCHLGYKIIDNIPNMLIDEAIKIQDGKDN